MENQSVLYSYKRKMKVETLASARAIKVSEDQAIDPALLFQRFLVVSQSGELGFNDVLKYELSPYPPSLFEAKYVLRKPDKAQLQEACNKRLCSFNRKCCSSDHSHTLIITFLMEVHSCIA